MIAAPRNQRGFVLTEVLMVMVVSLILLSSTLLTFGRLVTNNRVNDLRNDTAEQARRALDVEARQLRNLAKRLNNSPVIDTVGSYDLIFQTSDPSRTWVRYCLDGSKGPARGRIWEQTKGVASSSSSSPVTAAMKGVCGVNSAWSQTTLVADYVVNKINGRDYPLFSYRCSGGGTACTASSASYDQILGIDAQIYLDTTPNVGPGELRVSSGVYLRNQNQAPVAAFSTQTSGPRSVLLNASGSSDFEGRTLAYFWFLGTMPTSIQCDKTTKTVTGSNTTLWGGVLVGEGITLSYTWPGTSPASGTAQSFGLVACDPGDRYGYLTKSVSIP